MARSLPATRSYPDGSTIWLTLTKDVNILFCNTNDPNCTLYDVEQIEFLQLAGQGAQLEFADSLSQNAWQWVGQFYPPTTDIINGTSWIYPSAQRPVARFYRVVPWVPPVTTGFTVAGVKRPILNVGGFPSIRTWVSPRRR